MDAQQNSTEPETFAPVGEDLRRALNALLDAIPNVDRRPTSLARALDINRVILSRLLNALKRPDPLEVLHYVPGPDSLRSIAESASALDHMPREVIEEATHSIEQFNALIRDRFGTRGALNSAISDESHVIQKRHEELARYEVYNGMRHVMGVEGETWVTTMIFAPSPDEEFLSVTSLHGVLGMRRLRPDSPVRFTYGPPYQAPEHDHEPLAGSIHLQDFYTNEPAPIHTEVRRGQVLHQLAPCGVGKEVLLDMLAVSRDPQGSRRYASPERRFGGVALFPDVPVRTLHCDAIMHESAFPGVEPRLIAYNPGSRGLANPNDPMRDADRIETRERIETPEFDLEHFEAAGVPNYASMLKRIFEEIDEPPEAYRAYRVRIPYPVQGFQYVLAFEVPEHP